MKPKKEKNQKARQTLARPCVGAGRGGHQTASGYSGAFRCVLPSQNRVRLSHLQHPGLSGGRHLG